MGDQNCVTTMCKAFEERHDFILNALNNLDGVSCLPCDGTFYCFANIEGLIEKTKGVSDDVEFAEYLLNNSGMAVVPGTAFGSPGHIRISYASSMEVLEESIARFQKL